MRSIDIAVNLLNKSIKRGQEDPSYYMDYIKLHKLMYLCNCYLNFKYGIDLYEEQTIALNNGPYVLGLGLITAVCGFRNIKSTEDLAHRYKYIPVTTFSRDEALDLILDMFGKYNTDEIVKLSKNTIGYQAVSKDCNNNVINKELMIETGKSLFVEKAKYQHVDLLLYLEKIEVEDLDNRDNEDTKLEELSREKIMKCRHVFVRTDVAYDRSDKYREKKVSIYHCLKCGVTNEYKYKEVPKSKLNKLQKQMWELYIATVCNGINLSDFSSWEVYSLDRAKAVYDLVIQIDPNITLYELEKNFPRLYSNADKFIEINTPLLGKRCEKNTFATLDKINDSKEDKTKVKK